MDTKSINRAWMIKQLKFFRFLFYLAVLYSMCAFLFLGVVPLVIGLALAVLFSAIADFVRIDLTFSL